MLLYFLLQLINYALYIPAPYVKANHNPALGIFPLNLVGAFFHFYIGQQVKRDLLPVGCRNEQVLDVLQVLPEFPLQPYYQIEASFSLINHSAAYARKSRIYGPVYFGNIRTVLG